MPEFPLISPLDRTLLLRAQPYMAGLSPEILVVIASHCAEQRFRDGDRLETSANGRRRVYFLAAGRVRTSIDGLPIADTGSDAGVVLAQLLSRSSISFELTAVGNTLVLKLEFEWLLQIMEDHFPVVLQVGRSLADQATALEQRMGLCPSSPEAPPAGEYAHTASLDLVERLSLARRNPMFAGANLAVLANLLSGAHERHLSPGESLWQAGESAHAFALVVAGTLLIKDSAGVTRGCAGPDDLIGLRDLFSEKSRAWAAVAACPVLVLRIDRAHYLDMLEDHFDHARDLLATLARRYLELLTVDAGLTRSPD